MHSQFVLHGMRTLLVTYSQFVLHGMRTLLVTYSQFVLWWDEDIFNYIFTVHTLVG